MDDFLYKFKLSKMPMVMNNSIKLYNERTRRGLIRNLRTMDYSDMEESDARVNGHHATVLEDCIDHETPPNNEVCRLPMWDSGVGSPTPGLSPLQRSKPTSRRLGLSPIPFSFGEHDEEVVITSAEQDNFSPLNESGIGMLPTTPIEERLGTPMTPNMPILTPMRSPSLQRSLRSMKLTDGSRSPQSYMIRRCAKNALIRSHKIRHLTSTVKAKSDDLIPSDFNDNNAISPYEPMTNTNPFAAYSDSKKSGIKRGRDEFNRSHCDEGFSPVEFIEERPCKKFALRQINTSRLNEEFHVVCHIGDGQFGSVYKCINRLDGCTYAIKKSKVPVAGSAFERSALNEVYAHAVLGKHIHIVGYYSAWAEHDHMLIQNEYCNGGSLNEILYENRKILKTFTELELKHLTCQLVHGLKYIHSHNLAHLDLKPDNVFITIDRCTSKSQESLCGDIEEDDDLNYVTYKIGDFGMVTSLISPTVDEGDCRYMPKEILAENYNHLQKADIFSLALTIFEAGSGKELPMNGPLWHEYREDGLPNLPHVSVEMNNLLKLMANSNPVNRPSATELSQNPVLLPFVKQTNKELRKELEEQKSKNEQLSRQLEQMKALMQHSRFSQSKKHRRLIGHHCIRAKTSAE